MLVETFPKRRRCGSSSQADAPRRALVLRDLVACLYRPFAGRGAAAERYAGVLRGAAPSGAERGSAHRQHQPRVGPLYAPVSSSPTEVFADDPRVARCDAKQRDGGPLWVT